MHAEGRFFLSFLKIKFTSTPRFQENYLVRKSFRPFVRGHSSQGLTYQAFDPRRPNSELDKDHWPVPYPKATSPDQPLPRALTQALRVGLSVKVSKTHTATTKSSRAPRDVKLDAIQLSDLKLRGEVRRAFYLSLVCLEACMYCTCICFFFYLRNILS